MQGLPDPPCQRGIIPRAFEHIFESVQVWARGMEGAGLGSPGVTVNDPRALLTWAAVVGCGQSGLDAAQMSRQTQALVSEEAMGELKAEKILPGVFSSCHFWILTFRITLHMDMMTQSAGPRNGCKQS